MHWKSHLDRRCSRMITRSPISPATTPPIIFIYIRLISVLDPAESCAVIRTWQCFLFCMIHSYLWFRFTYLHGIVYCYQHISDFKKVLFSRLFRVCLSFVRSFDKMFLYFKLFFRVALNADFIFHIKNEDI